MKKIVINVSTISGELTGLGVYALTFARALEERFKNTDVSITFYANGCFYTNLNAWLGTSLAATNPQTHKPTNPQTHKPTNPQTHKPTNPQTHKPTNPQTHKPLKSPNITSPY
ncbi:hypothetical protein ACFOPX_03295 [Helicobacter baculiformis]|uniref:Uncharacterized protein n=1 Tax=Helicobacter baculiformis TaxID=427351 RepID=A0ABV7ZIT6_9HELI